MNVVRRKVSLNKRRYVADGFDLDLACILFNLVIADNLKYALGDEFFQGFFELTCSQDLAV